MSDAAFENDEKTYVILFAIVRYMRFRFVSAIGLLTFVVAGLLLGGQTRALAESSQTLAAVSRSLSPSAPADGISSRAYGVTGLTASVSLWAPAPQAAKVSDATNWDSPGVWADLAQVSGIGSAGLTLFVGWQVRRVRRRSDRRRQQQDWGLRAAQMSFRLESALNSGQSAPTSPQARTQYLLERLEVLNEQLQKTNDAFSTIEDQGDELARNNIRAVLQDLITDASILIKQYNGISSLRSYLVDSPGDERVSESLGQALESADVKRGEVVKNLSLLRSGIGDWLVKSNAMPSADKTPGEDLFNRQEPATIVPAA